MITRRSKNRLTMLAIIGIFPLAAASLSGCTTGVDETEDPVDVEDVTEGMENTDGADAEDDLPGAEYDGRYDVDFDDSYETYLGQQVTVSAEVGEVISEEAFTLGDGMTVAPLLIVHEGATTVEEGDEVAVTGFARDNFELIEAEEETDLDLEDGLFEEYEGDNYIEAREISMAAEE
ncbi:hypothetical protein OH146_10235 [Salinibacterium sp. SYSU T00001]|uniref:hypothetical protein n=1 Tax=Homoserinimonas sedimenticola TaxID=2986805 RepID=UPI002236A503|nr:hypothetical protein [Salinibacterium sedimenticola]MCW4386150.1 hypothetical protein [Salinibacterium sedimenticola]